MRFVSYVAVCCLGAFVAASGPATAGLMIPIPGLFGTGLDDGDNVLGNGDHEMHYSFADPGSAPAASSHDIRVFTQINPDTPTSWSGNSDTSAWIGPDNALTRLQPAGTYFYTTTFDLTPDLDPTTA